MPYKQAHKPAKLKHHRKEQVILLQKGYLCQRFTKQ